MLATRSTRFFTGSMFFVRYGLDLRSLTAIRNTTLAVSALFIGDGEVSWLIAVHTDLILLILFHNHHSVETRTRFFVVDTFACGDPFYHLTDWRNLVVKVFNFGLGYRAILDELLVREDLFRPCGLTSCVSSAHVW